MTDANDLTAQAPGSFHLKDCVLMAIATGQRASTLKELRDHLLTIHPDSIYNHFWGDLLQPRFTEREYNNDFASWVRHRIHDAKLAEELAVVDPWQFASIEELRRELVDLIEERLDESESLHWMRAAEPFDFIRSQVVVFDAGRRLERPEELADAVARISTGSVFYHFIDSRRRTADGVDDFRQWLSGFGDVYAPLVRRLAAVEPYFGTLAELRARLAAIFRAELEGGTTS